MDALDSFVGDYSSYIANKAVEKRLPLSGTFELLPFCNMQCKMCYIVHQNSANGMELIKDVDYWNQKIDEAIEEGMLYCLITGGEPFIYPGIFELLECIHKKPIHLAINTNGTLLNREKVERLKKIYPGRINISLYGASNETYARLCGNPNGFTQVTNAFALLNEYEIPFRVHTTLTPDNYQDFNKIIEVCNKYKAPLQMVYYMFPPYRKDEGHIPNDARFNPEEASRVALRILKNKIPDRRQRKMHLEAVCNCFEEPECYSLYGMETIPCRGGYASFWVDWRGEVSGCGIHEDGKVDLNTTSFQEAWKSIVDRTENTKISEKCQYCNYRCICPVCPAAAFCETGCMDGTPEYLCEFSARYADLLRKELENLRKDVE